MPGTAFLVIICTSLMAFATALVFHNDVDIGPKIIPFATFSKPQVFFPISGLLTPQLPLCAPPGVARDCICGGTACDPGTPFCAMGPTANGIGLQCTSLSSCTRTAPQDCTCGGALPPDNVRIYCNPRNQTWIKYLIPGNPGGSCAVDVAMDCLCDGFVCAGNTPYCDVRMDGRRCILTPPACTMFNEAECLCGAGVVELCTPPQVCTGTGKPEFCEEPIP